MNHHHHHTNGHFLTTAAATAKRRRCDSQHMCYCKVLFLGLGWIYGLLLLVAKKWHVTEDFTPFTAPHLQQQHRKRISLLSRLLNNASSITRQQRDFLQDSDHDDVKEPSIASNLWDESTLIPDWMKEYFKWHQQQRALITPDNWSNFSYLVMQCAKFDRKCGGTADRLKPTPMMILLAHQMKRILFIHWQRPVALEEFLLPPRGGMDWRMPDFLQPDIGAIHSPIKAIVKMERMINASNVTINVRYQSYTGGATYYDMNKPSGPNFTDIYHDVWKVMFTPHPTIATMVQDQLRKLRLQPHQYTSIHLRAHYRVEREKRPPKYMQTWAPNAVKCASQLLPGGPFFFASDSSHAIHMAQEFGAQQQVRVVAREEEKTSYKSDSKQTKDEPLHLDMASNRQHPSDYYDTFVDLYLLALGKCVSFGVGGFGTWALLISANATCGIKHFNGNSITPCKWNHGRPEKQQQKLKLPDLAETKQSEPLFLPPMQHVSSEQ